MGMAGYRAPIHKGCKQGAPEWPVLWNFLLGEALGARMKEWQRRGCGVYLLAFAVGPQETACKSWGHKSSLY